MRSTDELQIIWLCRLRCVAVALLLGPPDTLDPKMVQLGTRSTPVAPLIALISKVLLDDGNRILNPQGIFLF